MARALLGYVGTNNNNEQVLAMHVARLRRRVAELEAELAELRKSRHAEMDLELHDLNSIAEVAEPALT
jgi:cell division protein FtsB